MDALLAAPGRVLLVDDEKPLTSPVTMSPVSGRTPDENVAR
jgi:hypothetical protein